MQYYNYPKIAFRYPQLIHVVYLLNWLTQLRKWYVYPAIKKKLKELKAGDTVIDLGCGEGQFLLPFVKQFPHIQFAALDNNAENIAFIKRYIDHFGLKNVQTLYDTITDFRPSESIQFAWCIGVMQYIKEDEKAVEKMGVCNELLLYLPINKKIETALYRWTIQTFNNYDKQNEVHRIYTVKQLTTLIQERFHILSSKESYGKVGRLSHECYTALTDFVFHANFLLKPFAIVAIVLCYPFILLGMIWDEKSTVTDGNGMLLHLKSKSPLVN